MGNRAMMWNTEKFKPATNKGLEGGWSKHGGARQNIIKEEIRDVWVCQSCAKQQAPTSKPYLLELIIGDWFRVCALCYRDNASNFRERRRV